jgi:hypothetical protein
MGPWCRHQLTPGPNTLDAARLKGPDTGGHACRGPHRGGSMRVPAERACRAGAVRCQQAHSGDGRVVHHQLPGAAGQGGTREVGHQARHADDCACSDGYTDHHGRAQRQEVRPAARAQWPHEPCTHLHRLRHCYHQNLPRAHGQAQWCAACRMHCQCRMRFVAKLSGGAACVPGAWCSMHAAWHCPRA